MIRKSEENSTLDILLKRFNYELVITKAQVADCLLQKESTLQKLLENREPLIRGLFYKAGRSWVCDVRDLADFIDARHHQALDTSVITTSGKVRYMPKIYK